MGDDDQRSFYCKNWKGWLAHSYCAGEDVNDFETTLLDHIFYHYILSAASMPDARAKRESQLFFISKFSCEYFLFPIVRNYYVLMNEGIFMKFVQIL